MFVVLLKKSQSLLFDAPVHVAGSVRRDGTRVAPHVRIQRVKAKHQVHEQPSLFGEHTSPANPARTKLDAFLNRHGGAASMARTLAQMTEGQQVQLLDGMAGLGGKSREDVAAMLAEAGAAPVMQGDLFENAADVSEKRVDAAAERAAPFGVPAGITKTQRRDINASVLRLVENDATSYTDTEKALMRQYSGNGGCGDSLNEFYTSPEVATAMWSVLDRLGVKAGEVLEPSCATGVFLHTSPDGVRVTGVELDPVSAAVAKALHGERHEIAGSSLERFATQSGGRRFKAVVGNAPFGIRGSMLKDDKKDLKTAEAYFMDTSLDMTEPGGIVAMIVPTGLLDAKSQRKTRERLLRKGEFLGAMRMPNTAFEHSHTEVTSDIVFFRRRPEDVAGALMAVDQQTLKKLGIWDDEYLSGGYYAGRGAENVLGKMEPGWRAKAGIGQDITVSGSMAGVPESIASWVPDEIERPQPTVQDVVSALGDDDAAVKKAMGGALVRPYAAGRAGDTKVEDGITYVLQGRPLRWHRADEVMEHDAVREAKPLAEAIDNVLAGRPQDRSTLEESVKAYIARHGVPGKSKELVAAAAHDKVLHRLIGAVSPEGRLSDVVAGRTQQRALGSLETAAATLAAESESGNFTAADLAERSGKDVEEVTDAMMASTAYAYAGAGQWTTTENYLTGELWPKLDDARAAAPDDAGLRAKIDYQIKRLDEAIAPKPLDDVEVMLNSAFLPTTVLQAWLQSRVDAYKAENPGSAYAKSMSDPEVVFDKGVYKISGGMYGNDLLEKYLNRTGVRKDDLAQVDGLNEQFRQWLLTSHLRESVEDLYNRKFRGFVPKDWSEAPIEIPGLNPDLKVKDYHWSSLRWALANGRGIIADDVGLGKTGRGLMLARLAKMYGKAQRPTFVVPKSVLANWVAEAQNWFPGSRVLVIGETYTRDKDGKLKSKPDNKAERDRKYHDMVQNDYDFVFVSQPAFNDLDVDPITKGMYVNDDFWVQRGDSLGNAGDKRLNRVREAYKQAVAEREFEKRTDAINFNDLGIDMMLVDEGHGFKNLYAARARFGESPKFLGGQGQSNRAFDMSFKARWLREQNQGKGVFMLTATPTKNSPLEVYSMLSYIAPEEFERIGIRNSEEFLDRYCVFTREKVLGTDGAIDEALVTAGFKNLDELREIMNRLIQRRTAQDVGLKLPTASQEMHLVDMTDAQAAVYGELRAALAESGGKDATGDAHIFSIMDKMSKAAMDLELLDASAHAGATSPKYEAVAKAAREGVKEGAQLIFCESVASHQKIASALERAGIPRTRIAIMNADEAESSAKRQNIADAINDGRLDVVIGNKTMEEGVNLQVRTTDIHHMDTPWNAAALQQRNGRGLRQGNRNEAMRLHTYLSRGSFDGYRYQSMSAKKDWSDMLWNGADRVDNLAREGAFNRDDLMIMMSSDPDAERAKLESDKTAALERHTAQKRVEASSEFVRFQSLQRSLRQLKDKGSKSAVRLQQQIEKAKTGLAHNPYFTAKAALDSNEDVLIHPGTGDIVRRDMGLAVTEPDGSTSRWVVTGVDPVAQTVSMRMYADTTGHKGVVVPSKKLEHGVQNFEFDKAAEAAQVRKHFEEQAAAQLNGIKNYEDVAKMPSTVLEANHDLIQNQLKAGAKSYKVSFPYGSVAMVNKETGDIKMAESYEHTKLHDTHDYLLPTDAAREKAVQAWMEARRKAKFGVEYVQRGSGRGSRSGASDRVNRRDYTPAGASYSDKKNNPVTGLLNRLSGHTGIGNSPMVTEAKQRLVAEQTQRIKDAPGTEVALHELMPLGKISGQQVVFPEPALRDVWEHARAHGDLLKPMDAVTSREHDGYAYGSADRRQSVQTALIRMALTSGRHDLAVEMAEHGAAALPERGARETFDALMPAFASDPQAAKRFSLALKEAERGGFADDMRPSTVYNSWASDRGKTHRRHLEEQMAEARQIEERQATAREAA